MGQTRTERLRLVREGIDCDDQALKLLSLKATFSPNPVTLSQTAFPFSALAHQTLGSALFRVDPPTASWCCPLSHGSRSLATLPPAQASSTKGRSGPSGWALVPSGACNTHKSTHGDLRVECLTLKSIPLELATPPGLSSQVDISFRHQLSPLVQAVLGAPSLLGPKLPCWPPSVPSGLSQLSGSSPKFSFGSFLLPLLYLPSHQAPSTPTF